MEKQQLKQLKQRIARGPSLEKVIQTANALLEGKTKYEMSAKERKLAVAMLGMGWCYDGFVRGGVYVAKDVKMERLFIETSVKDKKAKK